LEGNVPRVNCIEYIAALDPSGVPEVPKLDPIASVANPAATLSAEPAASYGTSEF